ncbi:MAG: GNAT family N-acetyltransferase [Chloroflexota bacterium]
MVTIQTNVTVIHSNELSFRCRSDIIDLCSRAFKEDLGPLFCTLDNATHVLAHHEDILVSHALWSTRWLQCGTSQSIRTAYVEMVATEPTYQYCGIATEVMETLQRHICDFEIGALSPRTTSLYTYLGWERWHGALFVRCHNGLYPTPNERIMICRLPHTPQLDPFAPLSAEWREGKLW